MADVIYITGHKNPDTDSICSTIAYAELKKKLGISVAPVRIGDINRETAFVLDYFKIEAPSYMESIKTQVSDLNMDEISPVSEDVSIKTAWSLMQKNNVKVLPIADDKERLLGIVTLSDITGNYMNAVESNDLPTATPLRNILDSLNARLISGSEEEFCSSGKIVIAAMAPDSLENYIDKGDIVLVGDRGDAQAKAVDIGAGCIILTCDGQIDNEVIEQAKRKKCIVMETSYDTFAAARLINQSIPVRMIMTLQKDMVCFNIHDYVDSIKDRMLETRYRSYPVVDNNGCIKGFISRYHLISQKRKKIILLDHNEKAQTVEGIEQAEIMEIIDHHRLGDIQTAYPLYFRNETVGSTSTLIANMYFEHGIKPSKGIAGILCAAILSDTVKFKSPTSTYTDISMASKLAKIAEINIDEFATEMFRAGFALAGMSPAEILNYDFKEYVINDSKIGIGQIIIYDPETWQELGDGLTDYMSKAVKTDGYSLLVLMVTDIINEGSYLVFAGDNGELIGRAFGEETEGNSVYLKGVISRKKQVVPSLIAAIQAQKYSG